jgi:broad specificity phosphatase PhoE
LRLIVIRHGQTACNVENVWHGWDECELTDAGLAQARSAGERLASEPIAAVYSSPSRRALQTAEAVAAQHGLTPITDPGLRERHAGEFEGVAVEEVERRHPSIWNDRNADYWNWHPPGGETFRQVLERTLEVVDRIRAEHEEETVALVTHMGPARVLLSELGHIPMEKTYEMEFPSTGITVFQLDGNESRVETLNDAGHTAS